MLKTLSLFLSQLKNSENCYVCSRLAICNHWKQNKPKIHCNLVCGKYVSWKVARKTAKMVKKLERALKNV